MRRLTAALAATFVMAFGLSSVRADSIDIASTVVTGSPGAFLYTYTLTMGEAESTTPGPSFLTVVDFKGLVSGPTFTPAVAVSSSTSAPAVGSLASNFGGTDLASVPDLEVDFAPGYSNPFLSGETIGTLQAISLYGPTTGVYSSLDYFGVTANPNYSGTVVPTGPGPNPVPLPASVSGGGLLFVLLLAGSKLAPFLRSRIA